MPDVSPPRTVQRVFVACTGPDAAALVQRVHAMGLEAVAAFDEASAEAPWVEAADWDAPLIARGPEDDPWADPQRLVSAALDAGADALHAGAGGSGALARLAIASGLGWVGAPPELLEGWAGALARAAAASGIAEGAAPASVEVGVLADGVRAIVLGARRTLAPGLTGVEPCPEPLARAAIALAEALPLRGLAGFQLAIDPGGRVHLGGAQPWLADWPAFDHALDADLVAAQLQLTLGEPLGWPSARPEVRPTLNAVLTAAASLDALPELPEGALVLAVAASPGAPVAIVRCSAASADAAQAAYRALRAALDPELCAPEPG